MFYRGDAIGSRGGIYRFYGESSYIYRLAPLPPTPRGYGLFWFALVGYVEFVLVCTGNSVASSDLFAIYR